MYNPAGSSIRRVKFILMSTAVLFCLFAPQDAHAYLNPGAGSYVIEVMIAMAVGGIFLIKLWWRKFKDIFTRRKNEKNDRE